MRTKGISTTGAKAPLTKLIGKSTIIGRCRYDIPFLSLCLSHSYARAPLHLNINRLIHFIKSFLPIPNLLGVHQKVNFGAFSWHCCYIENKSSQSTKNTQSLPPSLLSPKMPTEAWECPSCTFKNDMDDNAQECGMCASTRPRPNKRATFAFASAAKEAPVAAQPPAPAITLVAKKPAAVHRPIAGPTVPAIRPMATVLEIVGTVKAVAAAVRSTAAAARFWRRTW